MLHLHDLAKQGQHTKTLTLTERLPDFLTAPCQLDVAYQVEEMDNFYLIQLRVSGDLNIVCQRCMEGFSFSYENDTEIAVCRTDERAEQLLEQYETIVSEKGQVNLEDLVIDELHLYVPIFHPQISDCDSKINEILMTKNETY